ncbi:MAG: hypothetical protein IKJ27_00160 [Clostridia bacterium]|nr:hypothetical protein [Clostridia bacterium]
MTEKQIIKAWEDAKKYEFVPNERFIDETLELIRCKNAEIERLQKENEILSTNADNAFQEGLNESRELFKQEVEAAIRAEAVKEFGETLKAHLDDFYHTEEDGLLETGDLIDTLVKERIGADNAG